MAVDYKDTVNLPKTDFPMKANLAQREPEIQRAWEAEKVFERVVAANAARPGAKKYRRPSSGGRRSVNIDPGYMLLSRFILATGKEFSHRIYIGKGIYADLTLIYSRPGFKTLPWTYPDYTEPEMMAYLLEVRNRYAADLKAMEHRKSHEVL